MRNIRFDHGLTDPHDLCFSVIESVDQRSDAEADGESRHDTDDSDDRAVADSLRPGVFGFLFLHLFRLYKEQYHRTDTEERHQRKRLLRIAILSSMIDADDYDCQNQPHHICTDTHL